MMPSIDDWADFWPVLRIFALALAFVAAIFLASFVL
jgi:hypothetical protein